MRSGGAGRKLTSIFRLSCCCCFRARTPGGERAPLALKDEVCRIPRRRGDRTCSGLGARARVGARGVSVGRGLPRGGKNNAVDGISTALTVRAFADRLRTLIAEERIVASVVRPRGGPFSGEPPCLCQHSPSTSTRCSLPCGSWAVPPAPSRFFSDRSDLAASSDLLEERLGSGASRFENQIAWARLVFGRNRFYRRITARCLETHGQGMDGGGPE